MMGIAGRLWLLLCLGLAPLASADEFADTIAIFRGAGESGRYFDSAYGYAVFPTIGKGGFVVGGAHGKGRVFVHGQPVAQTTVTQLTVGFQLGGQAFSQIVFFQDEPAYQRFASGTFEFGANAAAVAITAAASAQASTATGGSASASAGRRDAATAGAYRNGMAVFTVAKGGLMYEASIGGQKFTFEPL
jgi:hypothetical protein